MLVLQLCYLCDFQSPEERGVTLDTHAGNPPKSGGCLKLIAMVLFVPPLKSDEGTTTMATTERSKKRYRAAGDVDKVIGQRMRCFRLAKEMSQDDLGTKLGVSFQQIQKYEKGTNRLSSSRLVTAAKALDTSVDQILGSNGHKNNGAGEFLASLSEPPVIALVRTLDRLPKSKRRDATRAITDLISALRPVASR
jgi:transcriptional regulator with XRE-family HTH domain